MGILNPQLTAHTLAQLDRVYLHTEAGAALRDPAFRREVKAAPLLRDLRSREGRLHSDGKAKARFDDERFFEYYMTMPGQPEVKSMEIRYTREK